MRAKILAAALCALVTLPAPAPARAEGDTAATFDVRVLGITIGRKTLAGRMQGGAYIVQSGFKTKGAGAIARAFFALSAQGRTSQGIFRPAIYSAQTDTGRRQSSTELRYSSGVPRVTGGTLAAKEDLLDARAQGGTLDPLTALFAALRDRPDTGLCNVDVIVFDGEHRSRLAVTTRTETGTETRTEVTCSGAYTLLDGFTQREYDRQSVYPVAITFAPQGSMMQAQRVVVRSSYGNAELLRR